MAIYFSSLPLALGGLLIAGIPDLTALPVILLSAMLQTGYSISLFKAYDRGPLSSVYPVARGSAPLFIFGLSYIFFDPIISAKTLAGIFCQNLGCFNNLLQPNHWSQWPHRSCWSRQLGLNKKCHPVSSCNQFSVYELMFVTQPAVDAPQSWRS